MNIMIERLMQSDIYEDNIFRLQRYIDLQADIVKNIYINGNQIYGYIDIQIN